MHAHRMPQVKILRPESYWFNQVGKVVSVDQVSTSKRRREAIEDVVTGSGFARNTILV